MRYLSEEWIAAADAAMRASADHAPRGPVLIDQYVDGLANYRVVIDEGDASMTTLSSADDASPAHARFSQSAATARAVAQGTTDAHQAFLLGHIRFDGDVNVLIERRAAFEWLEATLAPIIAQTNFTETT